MVKSQIDWTYMTLGRKVRLFFAKKKCGFFVQWSFSNGVLHFLNNVKSERNCTFSKLKFHKMFKWLDCQIQKNMVEHIIGWLLDKKIKNCFFWRFSCTDAPSDRASYADLQCQLLSWSILCSQKWTASFLVLVHLKVFFHYFVTFKIFLHLSVWNRRWDLALRKLNFGAYDFKNDFFWR